MENKLQSLTHKTILCIRDTTLLHDENYNEILISFIEITKQNETEALKKNDPIIINNYR